MKKNIRIVMLCLGIPMCAISSELLTEAKRIGLLARMETGIEQIRSDQFNVNGTAVCEKWFTDYFNLYMGVQQNIGKTPANSFTGFLMGTNLTLYDSDQLTFNINIESQLGSYKAMYFSPGIDVIYKIRSSVPMGMSFSLDEMLNKRDTSWAEDDTETVIIESRAKKFYSLQTELKIGYFRQLVQNHFLQLTINPTLRHHPVAGEKSVDLGSVSLGHKFFLNRHLHIITEFDVEIPQLSETTTLGFKISLSTY